MNRRALVPFVASTLSLAFALVPHGASAQQTHLDDATVATRRQLIEAAQAARVSGDHAHALDLAQRAGQLEMTTSLHRFIAEEENALGRLAEALGAAEACASEAQHDPSGPSAQHLVPCQTLATSLRTRVGHVVVNAREHVSGMHVQIAGNEIPEALWGVPVVVNPGNVTIDASAPGRRPFHQEVAVAAGANTDVPLALTVEPASAAPAIVVASASPAPLEVRDAPAPRASGPGAGPWVVMGVGALGVISFGVFGALQLGAVGDRDMHCGGTLAMCATASDANYQLAVSDQSRAQTYTIVADVSLGVGIVALAGGLIWRLVGGGGASREQHAAVQVQPIVGLREFGVGGRF